MREIVHIQAGQCGNQIGAKVSAGSTLFDSETEKVNCLTRKRNERDEKNFAGTEDKGERENNRKFHRARFVCVKPTSCFIVNREKSEISLNEKFGLV